MSSNSEIERGPFKNQENMKIKNTEIHSQHTQKFQITKHGNPKFTLATFLDNFKLLQPCLVKLFVYF